MIFSAVTLIASYLLASAALMMLAQRFDVFPSIRGLRRFSIALVFAPIAIAWMYGWLLRLMPGWYHLLYVAVLFAILIPGGIVACVQAGRALLRSRTPGRAPKTWLVYLIPAAAGAFAAAVLAGVAATAYRLPLSANDPLEYFYVARQIFETQQLIGVYPLIDDKLADGFYGPWTHPPGFVLMIAWSFALQGTAAVAGAATMVDVYCFVSLILLVYAWAGGATRYRGLAAAFLIFSVPLLILEAFDVHVDIARIAMWTATFCLAAHWFRQRRWPNTIGLGVLVGLSMFIHSIGLLFWPIFAGLLVLVRGMSPRHRLAQAGVMSVVAALMVAPDYLQNILLFGRVIGDSAPLWEIPAFELEQFTNEQRGLASLRGKLTHGILDQLTDFFFHGLTGLAAAILGVASGLAVLWASRARLPRIVRHATAPELSYVLILACLGFVGGILLSIMLGMNLLIKNPRYLATMAGVYAIVAAISADKLIRYTRLLSPPAWADVARSMPRLMALWRDAKELTIATVRAGFSRRALPRLLFAAIGVAFAVTATNSVLDQMKRRADLFPKTGDDPELANGQDVLVCSRYGSFQIIGEINRWVFAGKLVEPVKVLAFRPSDVAYYAKFPFISYLAPQLIPAYSATTPREAHDRLVGLGVTHLLVPDYELGEINNTAMASLLADEAQVELVVERRGFRLFRLAGQPAIFDAGHNKPLTVQPGLPLEFDLSQPQQFIRWSGDPTHLDCTGGVVHRVEDGVPVMVVNGSQIMQMERKITVDRTKSYRMSFDMRVAGDSGAVKADAGLATFDEQGVLETDSPGAHRYGVAVNAPIPAGGQWVHMSGTFEGVGNDSFNQFRRGTAYVAPVFNLYAGERTLSEIRNLRLEEIP